MTFVRSMRGTQPGRGIVSPPALRELHTPYFYGWLR
jgi:hypothetical protein